MNDLLQKAQQVGSQAVSSVGNLLSGATQAVGSAFQSPPIQSPVPQAQMMPQAQSAATAQPSGLQGLLSSLPSETIGAMHMVSQMFGQGEQAAQNTIGNLIHGASQAVPSIESGVQNVSNLIGQQAQYLMQGKNVLGQQEPFRLNNPMAPAPRLNLPQINTGNPIGNFLVNAPTNIVQSTLNAPSDLQKAVPQTVQDVLSGQILHPQVAASDVANVAMPIANVALLGYAPEALEGVKAAEGFIPKVIEGVTKGAQVGGLFGAGQGLSSGRNINNLPQYAGNLASNTVQGMFEGAALGGITGGVSALPDIYKNQAAPIVADQAKADIQAEDPTLMNHVAIAPFKKALSLVNDPESQNYIADAADKVTSPGNIGDLKANKIVQQATNDFFPSVFQRLNTIQQSQTWLYLFDRMNGRTPEFTPTWMQKFDNAIFDVSGSKAMQAGFIKIPGLEEPSPDTQVSPDLGTSSEKKTIIPQETSSEPSKELPGVLKSKLPERQAAGINNPVVSDQGFMPGVENNVDNPPKIEGIRGNGVDQNDKSIPVNDQAQQYETSPLRAMANSVLVSDNHILLNSKDPDAQSFGKMILAEKNSEEDMASPALTKLEDARKQLSKDDYENAVDVAEGNAKPKNEAVSNWVKAWSEVRSDIAQKAKGLDLQVLDPEGTGFLVPWEERQNYFPHYLSKADLENVKNNSSILDRIIKSGKASNEFEARLYLDQHLDALRSRRYGNLEMHRTDIGLPYVKDPQIAELYVKNAYQRIAQASEFGTFNQKAQNLIGNMIGKGNKYEAEVAQRVLQQTMRNKSETVAERGVSMLGRVARNVETLGKLGLAPLHHAGQIASISARSGFFNMLKSSPQAIRSLLFDEQSPYARQTIAEVHDYIDNYDLFGHNGSISQQFLEKIGFNRVLKTLRSLGADTARAQIDSFAGKLDDPTVQRYLQSAGLDPEAIAKRGSFTQQEINQYVRSALHDTSLLTRVGDFPAAWNSPLGRLLTMFKSFGYRQAVGTMGFLGKEAIKGNVSPLATFLVLGTAIGVGEQTLQNVISNKPAQNIRQTLLEGMLRGANPGIVGSTIANMMMYPQYMGDEAASLVGGPIVSDAITGGETVNDLMSKNATDNITGQRNIARQVPVVGNTLANTLFPYKSYVGNRPSDIMGNMLQKKESVSQGVADILRQNPQITAKDQQTTNYYNAISDAQKPLNSNQQTVLNNYLISSANGGLTETQKAQVVMGNNGKNWSWMYPALKQIDSAEQIHNPVLQGPEAQAKAYYSFLTMNPQQQAEYATQHPEVLDSVKAMQSYWSQIATSSGKQPYTPNPVYSFPNETIAHYMTYEVLNKTAPGSAEEKQFLKNNPDVLPVIQAVSQSFSSKTITPSPIASMLMQPQMAFPSASPYVEQQLNSATPNYNDPQVQQYLTSHLQYVNQERAVRGLAPIDQYGNIAGSKSYSGPASTLAATGGMMGGAVYPTMQGMPSRSQQLGFNRSLRREFNYESKGMRTKIGNLLMKAGRPNTFKVPKMPHTTRPIGNMKTIGTMAKHGKSYKSHTVASMMGGKEHIPTFHKLPLPVKGRTKAVFI